MAEVLVELMTSVVDDDTGDAYGVLACGEPTPYGTWHGWLEFVSTSGSRLRSPRETTQPNRQDTVYWATGLTPVYIEGAFQRAKDRDRDLSGSGSTAKTSRPQRRSTLPRTPGEAADVATAQRTGAVLDPFVVYQHGGEALLRRQLEALSAWHLVNIAVAYGLSDEESTLTGLPSPVLIDLIADAVATQAGRDRRD